MPRLAANITLMFRERPLLERIGAAAAAGFQAIECLWPYEIPADVFRAEALKHGLSVALINTAVESGSGAHLGLAACGRRADFLALIDQALAYAKTVDAGVIHVMAGEHARTAENRAYFISNLRDAAVKAADAGKTLVIEPINRRDRPNWYLETSGQALALLADIDHPAVKLLFDVYHAQITEGDLTRRIEACFPLIGHVQIAGVPNRHEPDEGEVNYDSVFSTLARLGYGGAIGCEYNPRGNTEDGLKWAARYGVTAKETASRN